MENRTTFDSLIANVARVGAASDDQLADAMTTARALVGETFGSYRIVAPIGAGGMGWVFLAEHTVLGSRAAVKVLKPSHSQQQHLVQRFFDEARAATRVADPGIVTVLDFGWHASGAAYLVMEYLTGQTLAQRVHGGGPMVPAHALAVVRQCAIVMAPAHARGIVHRDLKPDNIFIVPDPAIASERIKVLDFGIAKLLGEGDASHGGTSTGMILGTPGYMSPEQCRGAGDVDHRTDIYALGCVLFFMLCGRPPFLASTPADLIAAHLTTPPPAPSSLVHTIAPAVDALVARCLAKSTTDRVQSMRELAAMIDQIAGPTGMPLANILAIGTQPAPATSLVPRATAIPITDGSIGPARRSRAWLAIVGAVVVAAGALVAVVLSRSDERPQADPPAPPPIVTPAPTSSRHADRPVVTIDAGVTDAAPVKKTDERPHGHAPKVTRPPVHTEPPVHSGSGSAAETGGTSTTVKATGSASPPAPPAGSAAGSDDPFDRR